MLGDASRQPVAELGNGVEPLKLMMRAGRLERGPGDLGGARQRGRGARVEQPRPAPHQGDQDELRHRIQVERQQRAVTIRRRRSRGVARRGGPPVPPGNRDRELQPVVHHGAGADHRRPGVDEPPARWVAVTVHPRQPDPVAVASDVERMRTADVGDPGACWRRRDQPGAPGQPAPSRDGQVNVRAPAEYQLAAFDEPDDLARRGSDMRGHRPSLGRRPRVPGPPNPGIAHPVPGAVSSSWRGAWHRFGETQGGGASAEGWGALVLGCGQAEPGASPYGFAGRLYRRPAGG